MHVPRFLLDPGVRDATEVALARVLYAALSLDLPAPAAERAALERIQGKLVHEFLTWKWTEAGGGASSGKYQGCPFWSVEAVRLWDEHAAQPAGVRYSLLAHDHVVPRAAIRDLLFSLPPEGRSEQRLLGQLRLCCVGAVITRDEHSRLRDVPTFKNPWLRYAPANIEIAEHAGLPDIHRALLTTAGVLTQQARFCGLPPGGRQG